ncbi:MAG: restriction endonuclease [Anaerolineae bacterium]|nr:restriction endonuclease [Anaerolineae bacterium]
MSPQPITDNTLFYGDNLDILREYIPDASVDLVYLDPPFNSNRSYNVLFKDESGRESEAQLTAFEDTWHWNEAAERTFTALVTDAPPEVGKMVGALRQFIGANQMMAYLVMMAARLFELHRVLKPTGSKQALVQVKSGKVSSKEIRDLVGTVQREDAALGVFITLEEPTSEMRREAVSAGFYHSPVWNQDYPRIQLLTIHDLLHGADVKMPRFAAITFKQAEKVDPADHTQMGFDLSA